MKLLGFQGGMNAGRVGFASAPIAGAFNGGALGFSGSGNRGWTQLSGILAGQGQLQRDPKANNDPNDTSSDEDMCRTVRSIASASDLGDYFQYDLDKPVSLGRQKSAMLPIVNKEIEGSRVSIYNPKVQSKHPLLGLRFKNNTGNNLAQGPMTIFERNVYAGDTRLQNLQKNEDRLISYAIDLGTEVSIKNGKSTGKITKVKAEKGILITHNLIREEQVYQLINRSDKERTILIEHPNRKSEGFVLAGGTKPLEETADMYRFEIKLNPGKTSTYTVIEERSQGQQIRISNSNTDSIQYFIALAETSEKLKTQLKEVIRLKTKWDTGRQELQNIEKRIGTITTDQNRLRQNLREVPKESNAYKTYLKKFDDQETEMTTLHETLKNLQKQEESTKKTYEQFLGNLTIE